MRKTDVLLIAIGNGIDILCAKIILDNIFRDQEIWSSILIHKYLTIGMVAISFSLAITIIVYLLKIIKKLTPWLFIKTLIGLLSFYSLIGFSGLLLIKLLGTYSM